MPNESHDEFLELCAVSTSGELSQEDQERLRQHLLVCDTCWEALKQYGTIVDQAIPELAPTQTPNVDPGPGWSQSHAEKAFFERLAKEEQPEQVFKQSNHRLRTPFVLTSPVSSESTWRHVWMLYIAAILLLATLALSAYWTNARRSSNIATHANKSGEDVEAPASSTTQPSLEEQLSDAAHERELARIEIAQRDRALIDLRRQFEQRTAELDRLKSAQQRLENELQSERADKQDLTQQQADLAEKFHMAEENSQSLQQRMTSLVDKASHDAALAKTLQSKVEDLTKQLQDREGSIEQQEQLLAHDRDIRELIGARDLYIAEVYDVADNGATKKPYGRVFYTKGKSLIFYAYDLDRQDGLKRAITFQAWGRRGPDRQQSLNLGVFSEDNISKKRWVLKFNDPQTLAQIDAVFVTVEPNGGSRKPSSKPLLFAYLNAGPNHP